MSKITSMLKDKLEVTVQVDGYPGFEVTIAYLSRQEIERIRKKVTKTVFDKRSHEKKEEVDTDAFTKILVESSLLGWKGLTLEVLSKLAPIEIPDGAKLTDEIEYSPEDAFDLVKSSPEFDRWLNETIFELDNFRPK